jgi:beta-glucanase (GH16 family)
MEYRGQEPSTNHGTLHGPGYSGWTAISNRIDLTDDRFDTAFHVFAIEWRRDSIKWFVDDVNYHTVRRGDQSGTWVFNRPFYIILNVAVGGNWVGPPDENTIFPQTMLVDWVRVYQEEQ